MKSPATAERAPTVKISAAMETAASVKPTSSVETAASVEPTSAMKSSATMAATLGQSWLRSAKKEENEAGKQNYRKRLLHFHFSPSDPMARDRRAGKHFGFGRGLPFQLQDHRTPRPRFDSSLYGEHEAAEETR
jgi:hypothetical protein